MTCQACDVRESSVRSPRRGDLNGGWAQVGAHLFGKVFVKALRAGGRKRGPQPTTPQLLLGDRGHSTLPKGPPRPVKLTPPGTPRALRRATARRAARCTPGRACARKRPHVSPRSAGRHRSPSSRSSRSPGPRDSETPLTSRKSDRISLEKNPQNITDEGGSPALERKKGGMGARGDVVAAAAMAMFWTVVLSSSAAPSDDQNVCRASIALSALDEAGLRGHGIANAKIVTCGG